jgi:hypothetical protein
MAVMTFAKEDDRIHAAFFESAGIGHAIKPAADINIRRHMKIGV